MFSFNSEYISPDSVSTDTSYHWQGCHEILDLDGTDMQSKVNIITIIRRKLFSNIEGLTCVSWNVTKCDWKGVGSPSEPILIQLVRFCLNSRCHSPRMPAWMKCKLQLWMAKWKEIWSKDLRTSPKEDIVLRWHQELTYYVSEPMEQITTMSMNVMLQWSKVCHRVQWTTQSELPCNPWIETQLLLYTVYTHGKQLFGVEDFCEISPFCSIA